MSKQPNILFVCTDQQRWDTIGKLKPRNLKTPNFDRLIDRGVHLTNAFCQAPICQPARACMLTGQYPSQTGMQTNSGALPENKTTWASVLRDGGYQTVAVGRAHDIVAGFEHHIRIPFGDSFFEMSSDLNARDEWTYDHHRYRDLPHVYKGGFENFMDVRCVNTACHTLRDLKDTHKPWAMFLGILAPHNPYIVPEKYADFYSPEDFDLPVYSEQDMLKPSYEKSCKEIWSQFTEDGIRKTRATYFSMISMIDELMGRIIDKLDELKLTDNTIIVFTSDHGEMNGDHARWAKCNFYKESTRIPCIVSAPAFFAGGGTRDAMVEQVDYMPTLLDMAGKDIPQSVAGSSFRKMLEGETTEHKSMIYSAINLPDRNIRNLRTKQHCFSYGYPADPNPTGELYDLQNDPAEQTNQYDNDDYSDVRREFMQTLLDFEINQTYSLHKDRPDLIEKDPHSRCLY